MMGLNSTICFYDKYIFIYHFIFKHAFFFNGMSKLTGTQECSSREPNRNGNRKGIDNFGYE